ALLVQLAGRNLFAGAALAQNEHRQRRGRDALERARDLVHAEAPYERRAPLGGPLLATRHAPVQTVVRIGASPALDELEDGVPHAKLGVRLEEGLGDALPIDQRAVGRAEVADQP